MSVILSGVCKSIKGTKILEDISFEVPSGGILGLQGVNGSGKTMLLRAIAGIIKIDSGLIAVDGQTVGANIEFPPSLGLMIESPSFMSGLTGFDNLQFLSRLVDDCCTQDVANILVRVGLSPTDKRKVRQYSLGMRQRLGLAAAFMRSPKLLLLDEPSNALDSQGVDMLIELIKESSRMGSSVIVASHDPCFLAQVCSSVLVMAEGHIDA